MKREVLSRPFSTDQLRQRPGSRGRPVVYVEVASVVDRLNEAFDHDWSFDVTHHERLPGEVLVLGRLTAGGVIKCAFGGSAITCDSEGDAVSLADDFKAAASDALKKCSTLLGVGLHLSGGAPVNERPERPEQRREAPSGPGPARPSNDGPPDAGSRVTARQLGAIHAAARARSLGQQGVAALVLRLTGKSSPNELSRAEASALISELSNDRGTGSRPAA